MRRSGPPTQWCCCAGRGTFEPSLAARAAVLHSRWLFARLPAVRNMHASLPYLSGRYSMQGAAGRGGLKRSLLGPGGCGLTGSANHGPMGSQAHLCTDLRKRSHATPCTAAPCAASDCASLVDWQPNCSAQERRRTCATDCTVAVLGLSLSGAVQPSAEGVCCEAKHGRCR